MRLSLLPLLLIVAIVASPAAAAPHPRDVGDGVVRLRSSTFLVGWAYDDDAVRVEDPPFTMETVAVMIEVGVAPRLTLAATLPFVWVPGTLSSPATGDAVIGGLLSLLDDDTDPLALALSLDLKLPLYDGSPTIRGRSSDGSPAVGDGQVDVTAGAVLASSLPVGGAMDLYLAYRLRTGGITDAIVGGGRFGVWLFDKRFFLSALIDIVITLVPEDTPDEVIGRGYASFGPRLSVRVIDSVFLDVGAAYVGRGTNAPGGAELMFGVTTIF